VLLWNHKSKPTGCTHSDHVQGNQIQKINDDFVFWLYGVLPITLETYSASCSLCPTEVFEHALLVEFQEGLFSTNK